MTPVCDIACRGRDAERAPCLALAHRNPGPPRRAACKASVEIAMSSMKAKVPAGFKALTMAGEFMTFAALLPAP